ncbi:MAG: Lrp/AsnC family transcriptional regulator [Candidatus Bathyarchaeota archaeon]|jgi:DNA-binding Lrp family transcriptional regulator|nr:Lrp/AsnC family transcriptional regulator [Candidatus Bathyarchaeota archaeon A05DMB-5]MDH7557095.1 Lrp/AsnC family transcriptional regulator [Candidatus Bathyarchaeota archaeon]
MELKLDEKDLAILALLQKNCRLTARQIARKVNSPITTVFAKIKRMEKLGVIKEYKTILDSKKLGNATTAFILVSVSYRTKNDGELISQREIANEIVKFPEVQEVHIITGDWDLLIKLKAEDVDAVGKFIIDRLRFIRGIEKTLTCMVFETCKETTEIQISVKKKPNKSYEEIIRKLKH